MSLNPSDKKPASSEAEKTRKGRSPGYPSVALDRAIDMARKVYDTQRKQEAHVDSTLRALGYTSQSGSSQRALSALKQYGLTQDIGEGDNRKIKLTDAAQDLLLLPDSDERKPRALRAAALSPSIHAALWERYGSILPDDAPIFGYLTRDKNYHDEAARDIVTNYRATFALAKLGDGDDVIPHDTPPRDDSSTRGPSPKAPIASGPGFTPMSATVNAQEMPFLVGPGKVARVPFPMAVEDFDLFVAMLNLAKKKLTSQPYPRREGVWKNKNTDIPVVVVGEMKAPDGGLFYRIEGSETGIPVNEVRFS